VRVEVIGNKEILNGNVQFWAEKRQAERTVWSEPGILEVENKLEIKIPLTASKKHFYKNNQEMFFKTGSNKNWRLNSLQFLLLSLNNSLI
jgi:hypothetical protein